MHIFWTSMATWDIRSRTSSAPRGNLDADEGKIRRWCRRGTGGTITGIAKGLRKHKKECQDYCGGSAGFDSCAARVVESEHVNEGISRRHWV